MKKEIDKISISKGKKLLSSEVKREEDLSLEGMAKRWEDRNL